MSGVVFHHIAEGIMAQDLKLDVKDARDSLSILVPEVKNGNILAADYVLNHLGINSNAGWNGSYADGNPVWGRVERCNNKTLLLKRSKNYGSRYVPNVIGMGARDAVFMLESHKLKVRITGRGKVVKQSLEPGHRIIKGEKCQITLE